VFEVAVMPTRVGTLAPSRWIEGGVEDVKEDPRRRGLLRRHQPRQGVGFLVVPRKDVMKFDVVELVFQFLDLYAIGPHSHVVVG
jgi:hypothetical protein